MELNTLIYALMSFKSVLIIDTIFIKFQGWLLVKYHYVKYSLFSVRLGYIILWFRVYLSSSCDIIINVTIVQNCCRNLAVRGLRQVSAAIFIYITNC